MDLCKPILSLTTIKVIHLNSVFDSCFDTITRPSKVSVSKIIIQRYLIDYLAIFLNKDVKIKVIITSSWTGWRQLSCILVMDWKDCFLFMSWCNFKFNYLCLSCRSQFKLTHLPEVIVHVGLESYKSISKHTVIIIINQWYEKDSIIWVINEIYLSLIVRTPTWTIWVTPWTSIFVLAPRIHNLYQDRVMFNTSFKLNYF